MLIGAMVALQALYENNLSADNAVNRAETIPIALQAREILLASRRQSLDFITHVEGHVHVQSVIFFLSGITKLSSTGEAFTGVLWQSLVRVDVKIDSHVGVPTLAATCFSAPV